MNNTVMIPPAVSESIHTLDSEIAPPLAVELGLTLDEYAEIEKIQGRVPSLTELYIYSLMWSEHCGYKHSRGQLKKFPTTGAHVLQGPGENAGVISVGDGWAVAFKMESHNHPSAIEPFEGAATGVGGCVRDIFTMGARPIASLNSMRFGTLDKPRQRYLLEGAVAGISYYGNSIGVPSVGGEVFFEETYDGNCLINAMAVGLMREDQLTRAVGSGPGNLAVVLGSTTGRDGIGGASILASQEFAEAAEDQRPAVQVGDPFMEKLLIEACLELLDAKLLVAMSDLGAAGVSCAASEMASRGGVGIDIDVRKVPRRESGMQPFEVMVSESQERMLAIVTPENWPQVKEICDRWGVPATVCGEITDTGRFVVRDTELSDDPIQQIVADMPAEMLANSAPLYDPPASRPAYMDELAAFDIYSVEHPEGVDAVSDVFLKLLGSPNIASRAWIYQQFDQQTRNNTVVLPGADAAVVRLGDTGHGELSNRGIAMTTDCNGRYCYLDPYLGAQIAFAEAARNLACVGAEPAAITDCLNFGSPEKPEVYYTFIRSIDGLADICRDFGVPVVSGNVSFYNESQGSAIYPTPTIGMVGLVEDINVICTPGFKAAGDAIILIGETADELGGSEYLKVTHDLVAGALPRLDLDLEKDVQQACRQAVRRGLLQSAHDLSEGGLAIAIAESAIAGKLGANIVIDDDLPIVASLFAESQSRILVSVSEAKVEQFIDLLAELNVPYSLLGEVGSEKLTISNADGAILEADLDIITDVFDGSLERLVTSTEGF
ncbi:MAG: phosphoribosylformylglycinamidine synthase subunit PurL [Coriobacteriia bacterium]|nr:phosphoribosylformylglycinamidine synthase subunit PurL [Coriobacteriia bacterium]